jgi:transcriptional regulator with XRE-family HTH domain/tetratricopeptide (TPR) repeat protein
VFGESVRVRRQRLGLTQEELATLAGVSVRSLRDIEAGRILRPRASTVRLLRAALDLPDVEQRAAGSRGASTTAAHGPAGVVPGRIDRPVPAQLPADVPGFTGREAALGELDRLLTDDGVRPRTSVISAVSGTAGVGKTAVAVHWAHRVADQFPDGQLYVNLRGFDPDGRVMAPGNAVRGFLDALGVAPEQVPNGLDAQVGLFRSLIAGRRVLVVLDNARDAEQVRPLLPGAATARTLITSRNRLTGMVADGAHPVIVDLLPVEESRELLSRRLGPRRVAAEPGAVQRIVARCAGLPLALTIAAARWQQTRFPLERLAAELDSAADRLDALDAGETTGQVRAMFSWSYCALTADAACLFRLLGLHPGPDVTAPAAASLAGLTPARVQPLLTELTRASLVVERVPGRYSWHDLLRAYAAEMVHETDSPDRRRAATHRLFDHYLHTAYAAARLLQPVREPITLDEPQPGIVPEQFADADAAAAWFDAEHAVLLAVVDRAAGEFDRHVWHLAWTLVTFLYRRAHWHDWVRVQKAAVAATDRLGDLAAQASAHRLLGLAHNQLDRPTDARTEMERALNLYERLGDLAGQAQAHHALSRLWERHGDTAEGLRHAQRSLNLFRAAGRRDGEADSLNAVGWFHALLGDLRQAVTHCRHALELYRTVEDRTGAGGHLAQPGLRAPAPRRPRRSTAVLRRGASPVARTRRPIPRSRHSPPHRRHTPRRRQPCTGAAGVAARAGHLRRRSAPRCRGGPREAGRRTSDHV